jgi:hypothetical protein
MARGYGAETFQCKQSEVVRKISPMTNATSKTEPRPKQLTAYYIRSTGEYGFFRRGSDSTGPVEAKDRES